MTILLTSLEEEFLRENNRIEGITRPLYDRERLAFKAFCGIRKMEVEDLVRLVSVLQPNAQLRDKVGLDVSVAIAGGPGVIRVLEHLLGAIAEKRIDAYEAHVEYEILHPFTDGNGRSGRILWWWMMGGVEIGFLHKFYYQALSHAR